MSGFVHLHVHSEYSLLDGASRITELTDQAAKLGMRSLALTDHGVMYGVVAFYKACRERGIKPILGCEIYFTAGSMTDKASRQDQPIYHLILLAKNEQGYRNLMKICSEAQLKGFHYKPRADIELLRRYAEGIICLSSCMSGEVSRHLLHGRQEEALAAALKYRELYGDDFYLELQDHGLLDQKKVMQGMIQLSKETGIPIVATNDVHYVHPGDHEMQDCLICIGTGKTMEEKDRMKIQTDQLYLKSGEDMARLFAHVPEAITRTEEIAAKVTLELEFGRSVLPSFRPVPEGLTAQSYLLQLCETGLHQRYASKPEWQEEPFRAEVTDRLHYELGVIGRMGFDDYFLIVWDFVRYAHEKGIVTGPGRGSSAGSLVAYVLRITDVDPIKYRLLFERFLNPERISMPDIDIDFSDVRRDEVIEYVARKYGAEHVAQIITFGTMAAKAAVRDVGRVMNVPYGEVDKAAKLIPNHLGITIEDALKLSPELRQQCERQPKTAELIRMAMKVEGMPRHASTHAAGVVISREPLTNYVPLQEGTEQTALTQYSMEHLEAIGLLKMDFLGLRYLSIIERTLDWVEQESGNRIDFHQVPDDDPKTYELLSRGDTTGIFQLESAGMRRVLKELRPSAFEDIISVLALYRPGPMEFIPKYIQAKHGLAEVEYPHPSLEPILSDTYGIIVYQEQIMQIASRMAGFSLGEADLLRRAVSKKKREVLDEQRAAFVRGSLRQGYAEAEANHVYDMIVRFADYGFPRAHATAYGVLAFQTAYLKAHYPVQFMASMLASVMGNHRKIAEYVDECRRMKIPVLPPDVNESGIYFTPAAGAGAGLEEHERESAAGPAGSGKRAIRFGLAAIKNVGAHAMESIIRERGERPYEGLLDFCRRVDLRVCNKRVLESLIQGGAMDTFEGHRKQLLAVLEETLEAAVKWKKDRDDLQLHLFGFTEDVHWSMPLPELTPYTTTQQLELEKELLGLYISGHPLDAYEEAVERMETDQIHLLAEAEEGADVLVPGLVLSVKSIVTKKGQAMAFMELENRVAKAEVVLFPELWKTAGAIVQKGALLLVRGKLQHQEEEVKLIADQVIRLDDPDAAQLARRARGRLQRAAAGGTPQSSRGGPQGLRSGGSSASAAPRAGASPGVGGARSGGGSVRAAAGTGSGDSGRRGGSQPGAQQNRASEGGSRNSGYKPSHSGSVPSGTPNGSEPGDSALSRGPQAPAYQQQQQQRMPNRTGAGAGGPENPGASRRTDNSPAPVSRVYIKITPQREDPLVLRQLKGLLQQYAGKQEVVLFYEAEQKLLALSQAYRVQAGPALTRAVEHLLGQGTVRVK
ncbi:DNA polymerase III subunit alpha [Paenibacillus sp. y28]|uniref:DNA polymerase III subunit alpha n=1 Tax=Paenibacillus sp. y28 TaxID=3129110 RepID=UPI00301B352E